MAESLLLIPDFFHWLLTGEKTNEFTNATTTQFFNPASGQWAAELLEKLGLPARLLRPVVQPGTNLGTIAKRSRGRNGTRWSERRSPRHARHGQRRARGAGQEQAGRAARLVLHQFGHLVA